MSKERILPCSSTIMNIQDGKFSLFMLHFAFSAFTQRLISPRFWPHTLKSICSWSTWLVLTSMNLTCVTSPLSVLSHPHRGHWKQQKSSATSPSSGAQRAHLYVWSSHGPHPAWWWHTGSDLGLSGTLSVTSHLSCIWWQSQGWCSPQTEWCSQPGRKSLHRNGSYTVISLINSQFDYSTNSLYNLQGNRHMNTQEKQLHYWFFLLFFMLILAYSSAWKLTSCPKQQPNSSDTLFATDIAATLRGWVHPIFPLEVYPASARYWVIWVVFPDPVSPITIRIWLSCTA